MPRIVSENETLPGWCLLKQFSIMDLDKRGIRLEALWPNERLVSCGGSLNVAWNGNSQVVANGQFLDLRREDDPVYVTPVNDKGIVVRLSGEWGTELGGCGIFAAEDTEKPSNRGDAVSYEKTTSIDSHYHDCDEYWILLEGRATVVVQNEAGEMSRGDCLCIGMGRHHDMPHAPESVKAVYFETNLERGKRVGHLWEHTHGKAVPAEGRD